VDCVSKINTGAKYNDDVFQFSVGLNGVGTKAVNALARDFFVRSHRAGEYAEASFRQGVLKAQKNGKAATEPDGTFIRFEPDPTIFKEIDFRAEHVERRLRHYAYLNTGLKLIFNGTTFQSRNGLLDLVMEDLRADQSEPIYPPLHYSSRTLEFCFTHSNSRYGETFYSFVNGQYTSDGGTHLSAFREGLLKAVNEYSRSGYEGDDVREAMVGAVAIRLKDPVFESQTKNKLGNTSFGPSWSIKSGRSCSTSSIATRRWQKRFLPKSKIPNNSAKNCRKSRSWLENAPRPSLSAFRN